METGTETDAAAAVAAADETDGVGFAVVDETVGVGGDAAADPVSCACKPYQQNLAASSEDPCGSEHAGENV